MALFYEEWNTGARETILWLHAGSMSGWTWGPQIDLLPDYHALVPDLPEHGKSMRERPFSITKTAEQLARLIEQHAHYSRAHVVGVSLGAQVGAELVARFPERVGRAVLSGTLVRPVPGRNGPFAQLLLALSMRAALPFRAMPWVVRAAMRRAGIPERYRAEFAADMRRLTPGAFRRVVMRETWGFRLPTAWEHASVPTLVVAGEHERAIFLESASDLVRGMPHARGAIAQGLGHSWNLEDPELFAAMVRAWLTEEPLPPGLAPLVP